MSGGNKQAQFAPTPFEIMDLVVHLSEQGDREAKRAMAPFIGTRATAAALPIVRRHASRLVEDSGATIDRSLRDHIKDFGAKYGFRVTAADPRNRAVNLRFTLTEHDDIKNAAEAAGMSMSDFARGAVVARARGTFVVTKPRQRTGDPAEPM